MTPAAPPPSVAAAIARERRLIIVEAELDRLIEPDLAAWTAPLEVIEARRTQTAAAGQPGPMPEQDESGALDVDEAEVTIVRPEAEAPAEPRGSPLPAAPPAPAPVLEAKARMAERGPAIDGGSYAAYHLEVEEASVEIIVPPTAKDDAPRQPAP